uniref:Lipocalin n=1 Tax=Rhipicephalus zambeziensis TaxID=60191 RepID=A0A224YZJ9_9ACAR
MNVFMAPLQPTSLLLFLVFSIINWDILENSFPIGEVRNRNGTGCSIHGRRPSPDFAELDQPRADWVKGRIHHILLSLSTQADQPTGKPTSPFSPSPPPQGSRAAKYQIGITTL